MTLKLYIHRSFAEIQVAANCYNNEITAKKPPNERFIF